MADKLKATVHAGGVVYPAGTSKDEIPADHLATITNPNVFGPADGGEGGVIVQTAPVFGLEPGDVPAGQVDADGEPVQKTAAKKTTPAKATASTK